MCKIQPIRGRGASDNPVNRFLEEHLEYDTDSENGRKPDPDRRILSDNTLEIVSANRSPDIPFNKSVNPYRGCEHGCIYCYARPTHEYLGFSAGLDFETRIMAKHDAARLLREALNRPGWKPEPLAMSGVTDPYQPIEKELGITRGCIEVLAEAFQPVIIITKNHLVTRDIDLLQRLAEVNAVRVALSITTLDSGLAGRLEPRTSRPKRRLEAIRKLNRAGIPAHVNVAPVIPGLTDHEMVQILEEAAGAGARTASFTLLRLPYGVRDLFLAWLEQHVPDRKSKIVNRLKDVRDGDLNSYEFGERFRGQGPVADQIKSLFEQGVRRAGLNRSAVRLSADAFRRPEQGQLNLF